MRLQISRVDHDSLVLGVLRGERFQHPGKDTHVRPPLPSVVEHLRWTIRPKRITPPQTIAIDEDYPVQNPPIIDAPLTMPLWKERSQPL